MRFTKADYERAIQHLQDASQQLEPDGLNCSCCGDSGHQAFECGFNPLVAIKICEQLAADAKRFHDEMHNYPGEKLHEVIHWLAGFNTRMGEVVGSARIKS